MANQQQFIQTKFKLPNSEMYSFIENETFTQENLLALPPLDSQIVLRYHFSPITIRKKYANRTDEIKVIPEISEFKFGVKYSSHLKEK